MFILQQKKRRKFYSFFLYIELNQGSDFDKNKEIYKDIGFTETSALGTDMTNKNINTATRTTIIPNTISSDTLIKHMYHI